MSTSANTSPYNRLSLEAPRVELIDAVLDSVEHAKQAGKEVLIYRFGFFRLPFVTTRLEEGYALHVWDRSLLTTYEAEYGEAPHNHNSFMRSRVLLGRITNRFWGEPANDAQGIWRPTLTICSDTVCEDRPEDRTVVLELKSERSYGPELPDGDYYEMVRGTLHSSEFDPGTVTLIHKADIDPDAPIMNMLPAEQQPRPRSFDITSYPQVEAWNIVQAAMGRLQASR